MTDNRDTRQPSKDLGGPGGRGGPGREQQVMLLAGRICCVIGLLFGIGAIVAALLQGGASVTPGVVGATLGILGYFLGAGRLGTVTIFLCVAALFFGLAASQGFIPGIEAYDRGLPANEPAAD